MKRLALAFAFILLSPAAFAQSYPSRPVKVIVPWPPGQATDIAARMLAQKLQDALGEPFIVDNRPGAGGSIGTDVAVKSAPDGYTLLAASSGPVSIMPSLQKLPYDPLRDLTLIGMITAQSLRPGRQFLVSGQQRERVHRAPESESRQIHLRVFRYRRNGPPDRRAVQFHGAGQGATRAVQGQRAGAHRCDQRGSELYGRDRRVLGFAYPVGPPEDLRRYHGTARRCAARGASARRSGRPVPSSPDEMPAFMRREQERYAAIIKSANIKLDP
jgi:hypothetical protein